MSQASPQVLYGSEYYAKHCGPIAYDRSHPHWSNFFGGIASELIRSFRPTRVFDGGCAHGFLVEAFWDRGVEAWGRDISEFAISQVRPDIKKFCSVGSIANSIIGRYDLVVCIEVVEHMPEEEAIRAIVSMTAVTDQIVFSSSSTDLTEPTHINVRPPIYWLRLFQAQGFAPVGGFDLSFITPHAFLLERSELGRRDEDLFAYGELVRTRLGVAERDQTIRNLYETVNDRDRSFAVLQTQFEERGRSLRALEGEIGDLRRQTEGLEQARDLAAASAREEVVERDKAVEAYQEVRATLDNLKAELTLARIEQSRRSSWRRRLRKVIRIPGERRTRAAG